MKSNIPPATAEAETIEQLRAELDAANAKLDAIADLPARPPLSFNPRRICKYIRHPLPEDPRQALLDIVDFLSTAERNYVVIDGLEKDARYQPLEWWTELIDIRNEAQRVGTGRFRYEPRQLPGDHAMALRVIAEFIHQTRYMGEHKIEGEDVPGFWHTVDWWHDFHWLAFEIDRILGAK